MSQTPQTATPETSPTSTAAPTQTATPAPESTKSAEVATLLFAKGEYQWGFSVVGLLIGLIGGFGGGVHWQKQHDKKDQNKAIGTQIQERSFE